MNLCGNFSSKYFYCVIEKCRLYAHLFLAVFDGFNCLQPIAMWGTFLTFTYHHRHHHHVAVKVEVGHCWSLDLSSHFNHVRSSLDTIRKQSNVNSSNDDQFFP